MKRICPKCQKETNEMQCDQCYIAALENSDDILKNEHRNCTAVFHKRYIPTVEKPPTKITSIINWISPEDDLPDLNESVLIHSNDYSICTGKRSSRFIVKRVNGCYKRTRETQIEWGIEENGGEYWHKIEEVILWAYLPDEDEIRKQLK